MHFSEVHFSVLLEQGLIEMKTKENDELNKLVAVEEVLEKRVSVAELRVRLLEAQARIKELQS